MLFVITAKSVAGSVSYQRSTAQGALDKMRDYQGVLRVEVTDENGHKLTEQQLIAFAGTVVIAFSATRGQRVSWAM
jgi:hypothetical protein